MISAVLPMPPADVPAAPATERGDGAEFEQALQRETGRGRAADAPRHGRQERESDEDAPGEHGRDQALAAMPVDVPARPVVLGLGVTPPADAADPEAGPVAEVAAEVAVEIEPAPVPVVATDDVSDAVVEQGGASMPAGEPDADTDVAAPLDGDPVDVELPVPHPADDTSGAPTDTEDGSTPASSTGATAAASPTDADDDAALPLDPTRSVGRPEIDRAQTAAHRSAADAAAGQDPAPAPTPVAAPAPATATVPAGPPTAAVPPAAVAQQLVEHVSPLVHGPDGTHDLTIELRPATLGLVRLEVTLEDGTLHVRVHAEDPASRRLLAQSLTDLRDSLTRAGIDAGRLDVGDPGGRDRPGTGGDGQPQRGGPGRSAPTTVAAPAAPARTTTTSTTSVDVLL